MLATELNQGANDAVQRGVRGRFPTIPGECTAAIGVRAAFEAELIAAFTAGQPISASVFSRYLAKGTIPTPITETPRIFLSYFATGVKA